MPVYTYLCHNCKHSWPEFFHIQSLPLEDQHILCPECDYCSGKRIPSAPHTERDFDKPIQHYSCAVHTRQEAEAIARACPDVVIELDERSELFGIPISRNQAAKRQLQNFTGYTDMDRPK